MESAAQHWEDALEHAEVTDIGMRRQNNQDSLSFLVAPDERSWRDRGHMFLVADGMGAHAAGELASKLACDSIPHNYSKMRDIDPVLALRQAIAGANTEIYARGQAEAAFHGMGTTCSALLLLPEGAFVGHVGDSRVYRQRGDQLEQLTFDHSLVWELRAAGQTAGAESLPKNIITRSLGPNPQVQIDLEGPFPIRPGDTFILCSDGLTGPVKDVELGTIVRCLPPADAARTLVDLANLRGGPDNISVIIVRVVLPPVATEVESDRNQAGGKSFIQPIAWILAGLSLAAAIGLMFWGLKAFAAAAGLCATVALVVALIQRSGPSATAEGGTPVRPPLSNGPYVSIACPPTREVADELSNVSTQLREAAKQQKWRVDWTQFERLRAEAKQAAESGDLAAAIRAQARSIILVVDDLRRRRGELANPADSNVDLL